MQHLISPAPSIEAGVDGLQHVGKRCEVAVVSCEAPCQLPHSLDRSKLRAVGRQEKQAQLSGMAMKKGGQEFCVMISGIVEHNDHSPSGRLLAQQAPEESAESRGVEDRTHHAYELTGTQADGAEASHRLAGRRMLQDGVLDFRRYPHATARTVLLEVTFIKAPQFDVGTAGQATEFFLLPRLSADPIERLEGAACVAEIPFVERVADTGAPPDPRRIGDADVPTTPDRPRAWPPGRSHAGSCAGRLAPRAIASHPAYAVVPLARLPAKRLGRPARSGSPSVARSCHSRQTTPRLLGRIVLPSPTAIHAVDDRNATPRYVRSPAESQFASPQHPRFAACASSFSRRKERRNDIMMLHYLCRCV